MFQITRKEYFDIQKFSNGEVDIFNYNHNRIHLSCACCSSNSNRWDRTELKETSKQFMKT